jgi:peroxin-19
MMGQLMSKEVLYDPLKELADGVAIFPLLSQTLLTVSL